MSDIQTALRTSLLGNEDICRLLGVYAGDPSIHTRRPIPSEATYPAVMISKTILASDFDALSDQRTFIIHDVAVYGQQPEQYRIIDGLGWMIRGLFHRRKDSILVNNQHIVDVVASGPMPAPTEDEKLTGSIISLTIRFQVKGTRS